LELPSLKRRYSLENASSSAGQTLAFVTPAFLGLDETPEIKGVPSSTAVKEPKKELP
jgi:hypothetical protein